ncbi:Exostosin-like 3, partial [Taenia solium]
RFEFEDKNEIEGVAGSNETGHALLNRALLDLRAYLLKQSMKICTSEMEFRKYFTTAYSLLSRLSTKCAPGYLQLAMTEDSLLHCLSNRKDDYCFSFVKPSSALSAKALIAAPDFGVNRKAFASVIFGLVFPHWPIAPITLVSPQPVFDSTLKIKNPYNKPYVIGADLGSVRQEGYGGAFSMVHSLSIMTDVKVEIKSRTDITCFPNGLPTTHENSQFLPCSQAGHILQNSSFCLVVVSNWEALTSAAVLAIHAQLWTCFYYRSIPVIPTKYEAVEAEKYLPFFRLLESLWSKAIVFQSFTNAYDFVSKLKKMPSEERVMRLDKISKLFSRHLETVGKQVETAVATLNKALSLPQPAVPSVQTHLVAKIPRTQVRVYTLNGDYHENKSIMSSNLPQTEPLCKSPMRTDFEGPLWTFDKTPWTMCSEAIFLTYERIAMLIENIKSFRHVNVSLESVVVVWNHPHYMPESYEWPNTPFPIHVIRVPSNKLQSRFLPFDLIKTDAVLSVDDDVVPEPKAIDLGFRVWNDNPDRIVGYVARSHKWSPRYNNFKYIAQATSPYSLLLTGASFFHKYFLYAYTFELPHVIYASIDELMNCEDIAMNMLIQQISEKAPYQVDIETRFACPLCKDGLSRKKSHYIIRSACITNFIHSYGYDPLKYSTFIRKG